MNNKSRKKSFLLLKKISYKEFKGSLLRYVITVFSCVLIIVMGTGMLAYATTNIGENIITNILTATGLTVNGNATTTGNQIVSGNLEVGGNATTTGNQIISGDLAVSGNTILATTSLATTTISALSSINNNIKYVKSGETIQSVIDSCPVAAGSLKEGFTNPYVVRVPPGHEKEYYSLVRNTGDAASDKRNVEVIYEDNPDGMFQIDSLNSCDSLTGWSVSNGTLILDQDNRFSGENCLEASPSSPFNNMELELSELSLDARGYQGILIDISVPDSKIFEKISLSIFDSSSNYILSENEFKNIGARRYTLFFPFDSTTGVFPDLSDIIKLNLELSIIGMDTDVVMYIDNIRLLKTFNTPVALFRYDGGIENNFKYINELDSRGWKGGFCILGELIGDPDYFGYSYMDINEIKSLDENGHVFINHTTTHLDLNTISNSQANYEVTATYNWMNMSGIKMTGFFAGPGEKYHPEAVRVVRRQGGMHIDHNCDPFPAQKIYSAEPNFSTTDIQKFIDSKAGGLLIIEIHDMPDESIENYYTLMNYVEANFSHVFSFNDIPKHFPPDYPISYQPSKTIFKCGKTDTLTENMSLRAWEGTIFTIDPGGADRNITPVGNDIPYMLGCEIKIINTADAAETLTFDPIFTSVGNHDGEDNADTLTDSGENWTVGQLVGRTINNTTDGNSGVITANTATTITAVLSGGTNNDWDIGDAYTITPAGLNQAVAQNERGIFSYNGSGWELISKKGPENSGTATITSSLSSVDVIHNLEITPSANDISITPLGDLGNASTTNFWISDVGASIFKINVGVAPGKDVDFAWNIRSY